MNTYLNKKGWSSHLPGKHQMSSMQTVYLFLHKCAPFLLDSSCPAYGPGQDCGARAGAQAILDGQSQKILNDRAGA